MNEYVDLNHSILIVDDQESIHEDFRKVLMQEEEKSPELESLKTEILEISDEKSLLPDYELDSAFQGKEALARVKRAGKKSQRYALCFMDVRMPPGWDGIETIGRIWEVDPDIQVVICTAYADYSWEDIYKEFGPRESLVFLRKPFDSTEVRQLASTMTQKWNLMQQARLKMDQLEELVHQRTEKLEEAHEKIRQYNEQLEQMLDERTRELIRSERQAVVGQMVQGIVHNLNNPLMSSSMSAAIIRKALNDFSAKEYKSAEEELDECRSVVENVLGKLSYIEKSNSKMNKMTSSLLTKSRSDISEKRETVDLNDLVRRELDFLQADYVFKHDVEKTIVLDKRPLPVNMVPGEIAQVFQNLVRNAIDAMHGMAKPSLSIHTFPDGKWVRLKVTDSGPGIADTNIDKIFSPFFTTKTTIRENGEKSDEPTGTGLGLWMCQEILENLGGSIEAENSPEHGAIFTVTIPATTERT